MADSSQLDFLADAFGVLASNINRTAATKKPCERSKWHRLAARAEREAQSLRAKLPSQ